MYNQAFEKTDGLDSCILVSRISRIILTGKAGSSDRLCLLLRMKRRGGELPEQYSLNLVFIMDVMSEEIVLLR